MDLDINLAATKDINSHRQTTKVECFGYAPFQVDIIVQSLDDVFYCLDDDKDGKIKMGKLEDFNKGLRRPVENMPDLERRMDTDGDGELSKAEFNNVLDVALTLQN